VQLADAHVDVQWWVWALCAWALRRLSGIQALHHHHHHHRRRGRYGGGVLWKANMQQVDASCRILPVKPSTFPFLLYNAKCVTSGRQCRSTAFLNF